jgi:D-lactate dehydrogenase (cytochrome)
VLTDAEDVAPYLEDSAHYPGGHARSVVLAADEGDVANVLRSSERVLCAGAQSSLTGGATPQGGVVLSLARMTRILSWSDSAVCVEAGITLAELETELRKRDLYYPPVPTYDGATVGGTVACNAAGAATFKYGSTRDWVQAITVVLADGDVLELRRGQTRADRDGVFDIPLTSGRRARFSIPTYRMPQVPKRSLGYHTESRMDLVDLFIGSEGTLGVVTEVELRLVRGRPAWFCGLIPMADDPRALALVGDLRRASVETRSRRDPLGIDIAAVEYLDRRCLELLREDGVAAELGFDWPDSTGAALIFQAELPPGATRDETFEQLGHLDDSSHDGRLLRLCRLLVEHEAFEATVPALPGDVTRRDELFRLREAVPAAVNHRVRERKRTVDPSISKSGGDVIVPFERVGESLRRYREILTSHGLDHAIWGHVSDGNFHPNALAATAAQMVLAKEAQLEIGRVAIVLGGAPMSEHGVGRNPVKQALLREVYGETGIDEMRAVKAALDPTGKLAPGVLFEARGR